MEQIHDFYSLRWQIEIIFKTWKSLFQIHHWQTIKKERLECHVYGRLIAIFICSSTMFKMRKLLLQKNKRELSEYKAIGMIQASCIAVISSDTEKHPKSNKDFNPFVRPPTEEWTEISSI